MIKIVVRKTYDEVSEEAFKPIKEVLSGEKPVLVWQREVLRLVCTRK